MLCRGHNPAKAQRKYESQPRDVKKQPILGMAKAQAKAPRSACAGHVLVEG